MTAAEILRHVDHTLLRPDALYRDFEKAADEALQYHTASLCLPSSLVRPIRKEYPMLRLTTVIGFPHGNANIRGKLAETQKALLDGADEIDMVINITALKSGDINYVYDEMKRMRTLTEGHILKIIVETGYLTEDEKIEACHLVTEAKADYIKTSTGFGPKGATLEDVKLFKREIGPKVKIKAAGGIHTKEEMEAYLNLGVDRIGASGAVKVLAAEWNKETGVIEGTEN